MYPRVASVEVVGQTKNDTKDDKQCDCDKITRNLLSARGHVSQEDFLVWTVDNVLAQEMGQLIVQLCHVTLGLRPASRAEERRVPVSLLPAQPTTHNKNFGK